MFVLKGALGGSTTRLASAKDPLSVRRGVKNKLEDVLHLFEGLVLPVILEGTTGGPDLRRQREEKGRECCQPACSWRQESKEWR